MGHVSGCARCSHATIASAKSSSRRAGILRFGFRSVSETRSIEKLRREHVLDAFDCGQPDLNGWLIRHALQNQGASAAQTYVGLVNDAVVGYYSLAAGQVEYADAPERLRKGLARHPVPIMLLARLAVHKDWQGEGIGRAPLPRPAARP